MKRLLIFSMGLAALVASSMASAQTSEPLKWNEAIVSWQLPTMCMDGTPIANCPLTSVIVETSTSVSSGYVSTGMLPPTTTSYKFTGLSAGVHYYRVMVQSVNASSDYSNVVSKNNVQPAPPRPGAATIVTVQTQAMSVKADWESLAFVPNNEIGTVPLGIECDASRSLGNGWYAVPTSAVKMLPGKTRPENIVAQCGG